MELNEVADELYALPRDEFTPAREELRKKARASGDRDLASAIGRLRRPTVAAWLVNQLARREPTQLHAVAELGESLREAHQQLDGDALRRLSNQRRDLVAALIRASKELGEQTNTPVSDTVERELEQMFVAALTDGDAARALASGRLSSPKELADAASLDWPAVDPAARPQPVTKPADKKQPAEDDKAKRTERREPATPSTTDRARDKAATRELESARAAVAEAEQRHHDAETDYQHATDDEATAHQAVADLRAELAAAERAEREARERARAARRKRDDANRALRAAERRLDATRQRLTSGERNGAATNH